MPGELLDATHRGEAAAPRHRGWLRASNFIWAIVIALSIRAMVLETYFVPSESMLPTLMIGDHMLVDKFSYGAKLPFTDLRLPAMREPRRGEVVTFELGRNAEGEICPIDRCPGRPVEGFVKRLIGLPGDTIEFRSGNLYLNDVLVPVRFETGSLLDVSGRRLRIGLEALPGASHPVLDDPEHAGLQQVRITVPEGRYFMLGDNRDGSNDSRGWGTVGHAALRGPVTRIYWSWNHRGSWSSLLNPYTWWALLRDETRWSRIGTRVE